MTMTKNQTLIFIILCGLLLLVAAVLFVRIFQYKKQLQSFTARLTERKAADMNQPVTVDYFDKDVLALADALNEYTDLIKQQTANLEGDRRQLKQVIAGISHDFRTPLTAAKGYMQMIEKSGQLDEKNAEYMQIAIEKTNYLKELSDTFFEVSAIEANTEPVQIEEVHLTNLLSELIMGQYEWIQERNLDTDFQIPEKDIIIQSNDQLLSRIMENLFSNAKKYAVSKLQLSLVQSDTGIVITMSNDMEVSEDFDISRVFEAFYRETARHSEGTGLGLYIVKCLADKLGMTVSADAQNTMFIMQLHLPDDSTDRKHPIVLQADPLHLLSRQTGGVYKA